MSHEASKAAVRRLRDPVWRTHYLTGDAIDIGAGADGLSRQRHLWPGLRTVRDWDVPDGDAQLMAGVPDASFDCVHSSHCLEHMRDPWEALGHWWRILRPGGHLVVIVPDEDMYEQGVWPSTFNPDHKATFTSGKEFESWSPVSIGIMELLYDAFPHDAELLRLEVLHDTHRWDVPRVDQTLGLSESAIEFVVRKRHPIEVERGGRLKGAA